MTLSQNQDADIFPNLQRTAVIKNKMPFGFIHWLSSQLGTGSSRKVRFSLLTCVLADEALWHAAACALLSCLGVESFAGPEFGSPAARRQEKPVGLSKAGAQSWTEGQQCEAGYRSFSAAALHRKISLKHRQHVSVTVDVHVRPCCYSSMFHWAMLIFRLQCFFSDPSVRSDSSVDSRLPKHISNAQCLTTGCLSPQGGGEDRGLEAKPIKYEVLVLHRWAAVENTRFAPGFVFIRTARIALVFSFSSFADSPDNRKNPDWSSLSTKYIKRQQPQKCRSSVQGYSFHHHHRWKLFYQRSAVTDKHGAGACWTFLSVLHVLIWLRRSQTGRSSRSFHLT